MHSASFPPLDSGASGFIFILFSSKMDVLIRQNRGTA
jgi:hypothetical protein